MIKSLGYEHGLLEKRFQPGFPRGSEAELIISARRVLTPPLTPMTPRALCPLLPCTEQLSATPRSLSWKPKYIWRPVQPSLPLPLWCSVLRSPCSLAVASQSPRAAWTLPWAPSPQCYPGTSRTKVFTSLNNNNFKQPVSARVTPSILGLFFCSIVFTTFFINYTRL